MLKKNQSSRPDKNHWVSSLILLVGSDILREKNEFESSYISTEENAAFCSIVLMTVVDSSSRSSILSIDRKRRVL